MSLDFFYDNLNRIIDYCVPKKSRKVNSKYVYPEWYTAEIIQGIKLKAVLHKRYKTSGAAADYDEFSKCRARVKNNLLCAEKTFKLTIENQLQRDPKSFWNYARHKRGSKSPQKILLNGLVVNDDQCAEKFAEYFHSIYSTKRAMLDVGAAIAEAGGDNAAARVHMDSLRLEDVRTALRQLKPKMSAGPDGIPPYIFKDCREVMAEPLHHIYNLCLKLAKFPERWRVTRVVPVPKGKSCNEVNQFRPVAILSTPAKILESAIHRQISIQVSSQLSDAQHGFRTARSTTSNLLSHMAYILPAVDSGGQTDAAYFDYKKAFDLVDNDVLLKNLAGCGFTPHLLNFFASYMTDRQQYVEYLGHKSEPYFTRSGVSQGSNLGPLEFILMINKLPNVVQDAKCLLFADDLKLSLEIKEDGDCERLQRDIDRVVAWSNRNLLQFNVSKCMTISFTRTQNPIEYRYNIDGVPIARVTEIKDLGVTLKSELTFRDHIIKICKKSYRNLGFVLRMSGSFTNIQAIVALYNALVRSQLECNGVIWSPYEAKYALMLERIQNKFIRYLYMRYYGVYPFYPLMYPTLFILGMVGYNELRVRRELALVAYIFKVLRGKVEHGDILAQLCLNVPDRYVWRRRRVRLLAVPSGRTNLVGRAPLTRALRTLNVVAVETDLFYCTLSEFTRTALYVICYKTSNNM